MASGTRHEGGARRHRGSSVRLLALFVVGSDGTWPNASSAVDRSLKCMVSSVSLPPPGCHCAACLSQASISRGTHGPRGGHMPVPRRRGQCSRGRACCSFTPAGEFPHAHSGRNGGSASRGRVAESHSQVLTQLFAHSAVPGTGSSGAASSQQPLPDVFIGTRPRQAESPGHRPQASRVGRHSVTQTSTGWNFPRFLFTRPETSDIPHFLVTVSFFFFILT